MPGLRVGLARVQGGALPPRYPGAQMRRIGSRNSREAEAVPDLTTILGTSRQNLVAIWKAIHGGPPPRSISQPLLRRILAFDLQLRDVGGLPEGLEGRLARLIAGGARPRTAEPKAGGRLLREWNGTTHVVEITGGGYRWNGQTWRSLSVIAREITGAHWSGPRFFGLKEGGKAGKKPALQKAARTGRVGSGDARRSAKARAAASTRGPHSAGGEP